MIVIIDNYDSFVENIARYVRELGVETLLVRNDALNAEALLAYNPIGVVISPGPKAPREAGICLDVIRAAKKTLPILGVCLGHLCLIEAYGGRTEHAIEPVHGRASLVSHNGKGLFEHIPSPFSVGRYHSLIGVISEGSELIEIAHTNEVHKDLMAVQHRYLPRFGVQFHPESLLTEHGRTLIKNYLKICGVHG